MKQTQQQIVLPLLDYLEEAGGEARTSDIYEAVATRCGLSDEERAETVILGGRNVNVFERSTRWAQQRAKLMGLAAPAGNGVWQITGRGKNSLRQAAPGIVITIFTTSMGVALFGRAEEAIGYIEDGSVASLITSPPYPLLREKQYGNKHANEYVDWLLRIAEMWPKKLAQDGSIILNLGDVWTSGEPFLSLYQERLLVRLQDELGWKLAGRYSWQRPAAMPPPAEWVTVRRVRVKQSLEQIYWLAPNGEPYADNRNVLVPYSESMQDRLAAGGERGASRPSGYELAEGAFATDNGGAIPGNLLVASNTDSNGTYIQSCRKQGLPVHPARFPRQIPEHFIKLTTRRGETVLDPFAGSCMTGAVAEELGRRWIGMDLTLDYLYGAANRFSDTKFSYGSIDNLRQAGSLFAVV